MLCMCLSEKIIKRSFLPRLHKQVFRDNKKEAKLELQLPDMPVSFLQLLLESVQLFLVRFRQGVEGHVKICLQLRVRAIRIHDLIWNVL